MYPFYVINFHHIDRNVFKNWQRFGSKAPEVRPESRVDCFLAHDSDHYTHAVGLGSEPLFASPRSSLVGLRFDPVSVFQIMRTSARLCMGLTTEGMA